MAFRSAIARRQLAIARVVHRGTGWYNGSEMQSKVTGETPEAVIFIGIPGSGKSTFYRTRFFETHVRVSLDMLRTRARERQLVEACLRARQRFVVDNTNVRRADRATYIGAAKAGGFRAVGYYFPCELRVALARNQARIGRARIPAVGVITKFKHLEPPARDEGFDALYAVTSTAPESFDVTDWPGEVARTAP
jgi:predicted kinase